MASPSPSVAPPAGPWSFDPQPPRPDWGVRSPALKALSTRTPLAIVPPPAEAVLCLTQGAITAQPVVKVGEHVLTGQPVARDAQGCILHASITGLVTAIESRPVPGPIPTQAPCVVIRRAADEVMHASCQPTADPLSLPATEICRRIAAAGIVGLGGALFPTHRKLTPGVPIQALIINGAECEPWITCDEMLLRERAAAVIDGARIAMHALGATRAVLAIEADMPEARVAVHAALRAAGDTGIGLAVVTAKYPAGGERQLIELVTGREVPTGGLPRDLGCVVQNVATMAAISRYFRMGQPLISRIITLAGGGLAQPGNFEARLGTSISELIAAAGGYQHEPARLLMGGPMMGFALTDDTLPVTKATNCIVAALRSEIASPRPEMPCIRCGECIQVCPARLLPQELLGAARRADQAVLNELGLADCIECGCCDYVCPSVIPLTARFVAAKREHLPNAAGHGALS